MTNGCNCLPDTAGSVSHLTGCMYFVQPGTNATMLRAALAGLRDAMNRYVAWQRGENPPSGNPWGELCAAIDVADRVLAEPAERPQGQCFCFRGLDGAMHGDCLRHPVGGLAAERAPGLLYDDAVPHLLARVAALEGALRQWMAAWRAYDDGTDGGDGGFTDAANATRQVLEETQ